MQFIDIFCNFLILIYFFVLPEIYRQAVKTVNLWFFTPFFRNAPRFTPFFVSHCAKFTVAQGQFYDGKFFAVNSKKGVNRKTVGKVRCLLERLVRDKLSSLLRKFVNYVRKKFYNIGHRITETIRLNSNPAAPIRFWSWGVVQSS